MWKWWRSSEGYCTLWALAAIAAFIYMAFSIEIRPQPAYPHNPAPENASDAKRNTENDQRNNAKSLWEGLISSNDPLVFLNLCLVTVTGALAFSTFGLWVVTWLGSRRQSSDMQKSIKIAERALISVERAFVFVKGYAQLPQIGHDGGVREWAIMPVLHNSGSTPTRHMLTHVSIEIRDHDLPDDFDFPDKWPDGEADELKNALAFIGPKADIWMPALAVHVVDLDKINSGRKKVYLYGWIEYDDVFPDTERHRTEFCMEIIRVAADYTTPASAPIVMRHYKKHNGADDECFRQPQPYPPQQQRAHRTPPAYITPPD
jgi:hypothetical protein